MGVEDKKHNDELKKLIAVINPEIYQNLKSAIELGKWADGSRLSKAQLENCLQATILYENTHHKEDERTGYIERSNKADSACDIETTEGKSNH